VKHTFQIFATKGATASFSFQDESAPKAENAPLLFIGICVTRFLPRFSRNLFLVLQNLFQMDWQRGAAGVFHVNRA
jgi:hypothetical protein